MPPIVPVSDVGAAYMPPVIPVSEGVLSCEQSSGHLWAHW